MHNTLRQFIKHSIVYSAGSLLTKAIGFLMIPLYTRFLTPADYGSLELLELTSSIIGIFVSLRIGSALIKFYYEKEDQIYRKKIISTSLISMMLISFFLIASVKYSATVLAEIVFDSAAYEKFFIIVIISCSLSLITTIPEAYLVATKRSIFLTTFSVFILLIQLSLNIYFVAIVKIGLIGILYSTLIVRAIECLYLVTYCIVKNGFFFSTKAFYGMLIFSLPLIPADIGTFILNSGDRFLLQKLGSIEEVGIYALGYKFGMILSIVISNPIQMIWAPQMYELERERKSDKVQNMMTYIFLITTFFGLFIILFSKEAITLLSSKQFHSSINVISFVTIGYIFRGISNTFINTLMVRKKTKYIGLGVTIAASINIILNVFLIPKYLSIGSGIATCISFFLMLLFLGYFSQKFYRLQLEFNRIFKIAFTTCVVLLLYYFAQFEFIFFSIMFKFSLILSFPFFLLLLRFYKSDEIDSFKLICSNFKSNIKKIKSI